MTPTLDDIRDIHGPIAHAASAPWWPYLLFAVCALALAFSIRALVQRRRREVPADQRALKALESTRSLLDAGDAHQLAVRVSDAVRGYVEEVFDIHAPRRTTDELLADLMRTMSPVAPYRGELGAFLEQCDLAKYARWSLSRSEMETIIDRAERFVHATAAPEATS